MNIYKKFSGSFSILVFILAIFLPGCFDCGCDHDHGYHHHTKKTGLVVVNVLDKDAYADCRIKYSINVTLDELDTFASTLDKEKSEVVFYCSNYRCTASGFATKKLKKDGFEHVWAYEGGAAEWYQKGFPVEGPCKAKYLTKTVKVIHDVDATEVPVITALELKHKIDKEIGVAA